jgi:arsenate reductase-like glutaredoxin family protein
VLVSSEGLYKKGLTVPSYRKTVSFIMISYFVPVVDSDNNPLMPTTIRRAFRWIKSKKATPFVRATMYPHEKYLQYCLEDCQITKLIQDLGNLYFSLVSKNENVSDQDLLIAMQVDKILQEAAIKIADLGPKPMIPHPLDEAELA